MPLTNLKRLGVLAAMSVFPLTLHASSGERWTPSDFQKIKFSDGCAQKEWSATPENSMTIIISAFPAQSCVAELRFQSPVPLDDAYGLSFASKGSNRQQTFSLEVIESLDHPDPVPTGAYATERHWTSDALRFNHMREDWRPKQLAALRLITSSLPSAHGRTVFPLYFRDVRLINNAPLRLVKNHEVGIGAEVEPDDVSVSPLPSAPPAAPPPQAAASPPTSSTTVSIPWGDFAIVVVIALLGAYWRWRVDRKPSPWALSPLYELNTRVWKSEVDADGVIHIGGFKKLGFADFEALKKMGFHSVWLMGVWSIGPKVRAISRRYGADFRGSPFAISDYQVSEELGSSDDFQTAIDRAHGAGLRVILDFVPNHMGLDSVWLNDHPEYFIHQALTSEEAKLPDDELEKRYPGHFVYRTPSYPEGRIRTPRTIMVAYGRDPYFYPWIDTAQLDYAQPATRRRMIQVLSEMAKRVDGVRCDMAMLVLRDQIKNHRHPEMSWDTFNRLMPDEFWPEAIQTVKRINPHFVFMAETYWSMEGYLQQLGFDYTYNKPLYESICSAFHSGHAEGLMNFLNLLGRDFLKKSVHFLENHDEERAMNALGEDRQRGAATLLLTLPGLALIHQGQMEGRRERLPVQRVVPISGETARLPLMMYYRKLLQMTDRPVFRDGDFKTLYSNNPAFICFWRGDDEEQVLVIINSSAHVQKGNVFLCPTLALETGAPYALQDLFYELKSEEAKQEASTQPSYLYAAAPLIKDGLYVELRPFDAHLFLIERHAHRPISQRTQDILKARAERRINPRANSPAAV